MRARLAAEGPSAYARGAFCGQPDWLWKGPRRAQVLADTDAEPWTSSLG